MTAATSPAVPQKRKQPAGKAGASPSKKPTLASEKPKDKANASILSFFKKTDSFNGGKPGAEVDRNFFLLDEEDVEDLYRAPTTVLSEASSSNSDRNTVPSNLVVPSDCTNVTGDDRTGPSVTDSKDATDLPMNIDGPGCSPPPPDVASGDAKLDTSEVNALKEDITKDEGAIQFDKVLENAWQDGKGGGGERRSIDIFDISVTDDPCPFALDEDEDDNKASDTNPNTQAGTSLYQSAQEENIIPLKKEIKDDRDGLFELSEKVPVVPFKAEKAFVKNEDLEEDFIEDEAADFMDPEQENEKWIDDDAEDDAEPGEELINRRFMEDDFSDDEQLEAALNEVEIVKTEPSEGVSCPICSVSLGGLKDDDVTRHVNACLDGKPIPLPKQLKPPTLAKSNAAPAKSVQHPHRAPQASPFGSSSVATSTNKGSAFSKLMSSHAEDRAWANAAAAHEAARGKRNYERICPFYKILPNLNVAVDAFRYGAVEGMNAYFLSHFHSDHYIGLSASWSHGPIYCSRVTANLCRRQLRVDPKWMVELEYEVKTDVPGTGGATVTMLDANHCPGSSLFLFEKDIPNGRGGKRRQRILHCGDFRAHAKHLRHPLLSVLKGNKIDICYLDTTYMNPKYAFPPQKQVIDVCAELCVSLARDIPDENDVFEKTRREAGITKFVKNAEKSESPSKELMQTAINASPGGKNRGRLLIIVGTYSIGKERICMGIAEALDCKIYAPPNKQKICAALENPVLSARLTTDPYAAQIHMTPLMEIRAETLKDYLHDYKPRFSRIVGFRPSGWNYRPPNSRFTESPSVQTVLNSPAWRSDYHISQMFPQRGSTTEAKCYGVPYSEHSSFRELTTFCCALDIVKIVPTVNVGNAKMREKMKVWFEKWAAEKKKNGFYQIEDGRETI